LNELFSHVNFSPKFFNNFYEPNELAEIKTLLFNYQYFINKASRKILEEGKYVDNMKEEILKARENK